MAAIINRDKVRNLLVFAAFVASMTFAIAYPLITPDPPGDLQIFLAAADGDLSGFYYAPWGLHFFQILSPLPFKIVHIIVSLTTVIGAGLATWKFGGNLGIMLTSYALTFSIYFGQPDGFWLIAFATMWVGIQRQSPALTAIAWFFALAKYYVGLPIGIGILWCYADRNFSWRVILYTLILLAGSFVIYGLWPLAIIERLQNTPPITRNTIDLWQYFGPLPLVLWVPVIVIRHRSFKLWVVTWTLSLPYIFPHGLLYMLMATGPLGFFIHIGYVIGFGSQAIIFQLAPALIYVTTLWQIIRQNRVSLAV